MPALPKQAIQEVKDDAEKDLAAAKPALDAALSALNSITPKDITALKALKNPPDIVKRIFDCVLLLRWGALCPWFRVYDFRCWSTQAFSSQCFANGLHPQL